MKVDFLSRFNEVSKLLRPTAQLPYKRTPLADFNQLLDSTRSQLSSSKLSSAPVDRDLSASTQGLEQQQAVPTESNRSEMQGDSLPNPVLPEIERVYSNAAPINKSPKIVSLRRLENTDTDPKINNIVGGSFKNKEGVSTSVYKPAETWNEQDRLVNIQRLVEKTGEQVGVDPLLGLAVASVESSFNPNAVSSDGYETKGIFQLLDSTGKDRLQDIPGNKLDYEPFNPELNVTLGMGHLRYLHDLFQADTALKGDRSTVGAANSASLEKFAVAAFNAGEGRVAAAQRRAALTGQDPTIYESVRTYLPESTQKYVERVEHEKLRLEPRFIG